MDLRTAIRKAVELSWVKGGIWRVMRTPEGGCDAAPLLWAPPTWTEVSRVMIVHHTPMILEPNRDWEILEFEVQK